MSHVPYASAVNSLMYAMVGTRLDIAHAVEVFGKYMSKLGKEHWIVVKRVFRYLCGTEKFSWCRGSMGIVSLDCNPVTPCMERNQQVGECWVCVIFFAL
jgi:hypothetical protein